MKQMAVDVRIWLTEKIKRDLESVINRFQKWRDIYWILVKVDDKYIGPHQSAKDTTDINTENKRIIHNRIIVMDKMPMFSYLSTMLWEVNNKQGRARLLYILPPDKPIVNYEEGEGTEITFNSLRATGVPLFYYRN